MGYQIAIDGPAGAGKSSIAKAVAQELGFVYMDTGAMYRAIGLLFDAQPVFPQTESEIGALCDKADITIRYEDGTQHVYLGDEDVSEKIRTEKAGNTASYVSTFPAVRKKLVALQQKLSESMDVVMDGRDIGTVVLPNADLKIFMDADPKIRAQRRVDQLKAKGETPDFDLVLKDLIERDEQDRNRAVSPLVQAEDAVYLDTSYLNMNEVIQAVLKLYRERK